MVSKEIVNHIKQLYSQSKVYEIEELIESEIARLGYSSDLMIRLALIELAAPIKDYEKSINYLESILSHENNYSALLILSDIFHNYLGGIELDLYERLEKCQCKYEEMKSDIELAKAWYFEDNNNIEASKECLLRSIQFCSKNVWNYFYLGKLYFKTNPYLGRDYIIKAISNVQVVWRDYTDYDDCTDVNNYFKEMIKGTHITKPTYEWIKSFI